MPQLSPEQLAPMMVGLETTYGSQPATFAPNTQGVLSINSPNAIDPQFGFQAILPHQAGWTKQKQIPTTALQPVNFSFPVTGGTAAATAFRQGPILEAAAAKLTSGATLVYTPAAPADCKSITVAQELVGYQVGVASESVVNEANGVFGNVILRGTPENGLIGEFRGLGIYQDPQETTLKTAYGGGTVAWSGGANNANKFLLSSGNRIKLNNGGSDYYPVCFAFEFDFGVDYGPIPDINSGATYGIFGLQVFDRNPRLTLTLGLDTLAASGVSFQDIHQDAQDGTTWAVTATYTDLSGRTLAFSFPTAQVIGVRKGTANRVRSVIVTLHVQHATAESEWTITHA